MAQQGFSRRQLVLSGLSAVVAWVWLVAGGEVLLAQSAPPEVTASHEVLKKDVGVWDAQLKLWFAQGQEPLTGTGVERNRMLGDFWLISSFSADMGGEEFQGHGQFGYDPKKQQYIGTWIDTTNTTISHMQGTYDAGQETMTMFMTGTNATSGQEEKSKSVTKYVGKDTRIFTMYMQDPSGGDQWVKSMEITYQRRPGAAKKQPGQ